MKHLLSLLFLTVCAVSLFSQSHPYRPKIISFSRMDTCFMKGQVTCDSLRVQARRSFTQHAIASLQAEINLMKSDYENGDSLVKVFPALIQEISDEMPLKSVDQQLTIVWRMDSIFRYIKPQVRVNLLYEIIEENGIINQYLMQQDSSLYTTSYTLSGYKPNWEISYYKSDTKKILGIECYKVVIIEKQLNREEKGLEFGDLIYEMYVTDDILLPLYSIIDIYPKSERFFALEIKQWYTKRPHFYTWYAVQEIVK